MIARLLITAVWVAAALAAPLAAQDATTQATPAAVMKTYCVSCHSGPAAKGGFSLDRLDPADPGRDADAWERAIRQPASARRCGKGSAAR